MTLKSATAQIDTTIEADLKAGKSLAQIEADVQSEITADMSATTDEVIDAVLDMLEVTAKVFLASTNEAALHAQLRVKMSHGAR